MSAARSQGVPVEVRKLSSDLGLLSPRSSSAVGPWASDALLVQKYIALSPELGAHMHRVLDYSFREQFWHLQGCSLCCLKVNCNSLGSSTITGNQEHVYGLTELPWFTV